MKIQFKTTLFIIITLIGLIMTSQPVFAQNSNTKDTSVTQDSLDKIKDTTATEKLEKDPTTETKITDCASCEPPEKWQGWLMIFSPIILFIICCWYILNKMNRDNFSFATAFSTGQDIVSKTTNEEGKEVTVKHEMVGSTSRTIAFFTGMSAIIIAVCLTAFEGYNIIAQCNATTNYDALWKILTALGIGVIPYGLNVWNGNNKEKSSKS